MEATSELEPAPAPQEAPTLTTLEALPDALLGRVLGLAGKEAGPSTSLVSKRWNRLVFSEPALWRKLLIADAVLPLAALTEAADQKRWYDCKLRLLQRVGPLVRVFELAFTALQLMLLLGTEYEEQAVQAIGGMPHLGELYVAAALGLPGCLPEVLLQLPPGLSRLRLLGPRLPAGTVAAALHHTALNQLELGCFEDAFENLQPLTALSQLTQLQLTCAGRGPVVLPLPCQFPAGLAKYGMARQDPRHEFDFDDQIAPLKVAGAQLERVTFGDHLLTIVGTVHLPSLRLLLAALQPANLPPFTRLSLEFCALPLEALQAGDGSGGAPLASLRHFGLCSCEVPGGNCSAALAAMLGGNTSLEACELHDCLLDDEPIPHSLLSATRLTRLGLAANSPQELPQAPVLAGLRQLDLRENSFTRMPPALGAATALRLLLLSGNPQLELVTEDLAVLRRMTSLVELELSASPAERMPAALREWLGPRLKVVEDVEPAENEDDEPAEVGDAEPADVEAV